MTLSRRALGGLTIGGSAAFALSACGGDNDGGDGDTELVWGVAYPWEAWNENTTTGNNSAGHMAMAPMNPAGQIGYDFDTDGNVFYDDALFTGPPELVSEEPLQLKINLSENAQWSDGEPVRVEDFIFHWYSLSGKAEHADQEKALPAGTSWGENVESIEQAEDGTILVTYVEGYIDPEWEFNGGVYLPSHVAEAEGFTDWQSDPAVMGEAIQWFNENLWDVVVGPYVPVDHKLGEYIKYEINENYQGSVTPTFKNLTAKTVTGIEAEVTELRQGEIHGCWPNDFSLEELQKLEDDPDLVYETYAGATWSHVDINMSNPFLKDKALREAVFTAIDIKDVTDKAFPGTDVPWKGNHFFSERDDDYVDLLGETTQGTGDLDAARTILEEAGYTWDEEDKLLSPDGEQVTFNFRFATSNEIRKLTGELVQSHVEQLGIDLELSGFSDEEFAAVLDASEFDIIVFSWVGSPEFTGNPQQFFASDSASNYGGLDVPEIDDLISQIRSTLDLGEAAEIANEISRLTIDQAFNLPLYDSPLSVIWNSALVTGPEVNGNSQAAPLWDLRSWTNG